MPITFKRSLVATALLATFVAGCSSPTGSSDIFSYAPVNTGKVIAKINNTEIRQGVLDKLGELSPRLDAQLKNPATKGKIVESIIDQQLLYQEAIKRGLDKSPDVAIKSMLNMHTIIANTLLENELETQIKKAYEDRKETHFTRLPISQLSVNFLTDDQLKKGEAATAEQKKAALDKITAIRDEIVKGGDFEKIAQEKSDDTRTKKRGGKAGLISKNDKRYERLGLEKLVETAFTLKKDGVSDPIETKQGYYLVKVTGEPSVTNYEDAKRVLGFELQGQLRTTLLDSLKKAAKIELMEAAPAAATALPPGHPAQAPLPPHGDHPGHDAHDADPKK